MTRRDPFKYHQRRIDRQNKNMPDPIRAVLEPGYRSSSVQPETRARQQPHNPDQPAEEGDASELGGFRIGGEAVDERSDNHHEQRPDDDDHRKIVAPVNVDGNGANRRIRNRR